VTSQYRKDYRKIKRRLKHFQRKVKRLSKKIDRKIKRSNIKHKKKYDNDYNQNQDTYAGIPLPPENDFTLLNNKDVNIGKLILEKMSRDMKKKSAL